MRLIQDQYNLTQEKIDIVISMPMYMPHALLLNNGNGTFTDVAEEMGMADQRFSWGSSLAGFESDGYTDLFFIGSLPLQPFFNAIAPFGDPAYCS